MLNCDLKEDSTVEDCSGLFRAGFFVHDFMLLAVIFCAYMRWRCVWNYSHYVGLGLNLSLSQYPIFEAYRERMMSIRPANGDNEILAQLPDKLRSGRIRCCRNFFDHFH